MTENGPDPVTDAEELDPKVVEYRVYRAFLGMPPDPPTEIFAGLYEVMRPPRVEELRERARKAEGTEA